MALCNMPIKAAIFDIGATLVTGPPVAPNKVIASIIRGATAADIGSIIMTTELESAGHACKVLEARFGEMDAQASSEISKLWHSQCTAPTELAGATETVVALKNRGLKIGLLSDIWNPYYAGVERALPRVIECADVIILSCRTGFRKPNPANFLRMLEQLDLQPEETVMIGDTYTHDILPALEIGMKAVWVLARPEREVEDIIKILNGQSPAPTATVACISEVLSLDLWAAHTST